VSKLFHARSLGKTKSHSNYVVRSIRSVARTATNRRPNFSAPP